MLGKLLSPAKLHGTPANHRDKRAVRWVLCVLWQGGKMARARRGQGQKAVVPHLEWDSNKARRCHGNRRRATPHPLSRERPQGASLSRSIFEAWQMAQCLRPMQKQAPCQRKGAR
ncbi:hypothetical protein DPX16_12442 [Anabarilius grahami]|uniref:Uncharacterized protein n=1 Tax=Anabarilius grahami TaxID=495550 RepID=A0A3N0XG49_ANAGA|nr:hypothetical protein DPX16_12442 [Anabarilius grahami]